MLDESSTESASSDPPAMVNDPEGMWTARCSTCHEVFDLESLGWIRRGAASWKKRTSIHCPSCDFPRWMAIVHVDRYGRPDQPLSFVLKRVLLIQAIVWGVLLLVAAVAIGVLWSMGILG